MSTPEPDPDPEITALETCLRALLPLDMSARSRVMEYLDARLQTQPTEEKCEGAL